MDTAEESKRAQTTAPEPAEVNAQDSSTHHEITMPGVVNHARSRPQHLPRHVSATYPCWKGKQECALKIGVNSLERDILEAAGVLRIEIEGDALTVHHHSQSKLSQQELAELQKATHFDKKELQQWYKGIAHDGLVACHSVADHSQAS